MNLKKGNLELREIGDEELMEARKRLRGHLVGAGIIASDSVSDCSQGSMASQAISIPVTAKPTDTSESAQKAFRKTRRALRKTRRMMTLRKTTDTSEKALTKTTDTSDRDGEDTSISFDQNNPKRIGSATHLRYEGYKNATTVKQAREMGAQPMDLYLHRIKGHP